MSIQIVFNALLCPYKPSGIAGLLNDILLLDERLRAPELQSEWFRMGIENHRDRLAKLLDTYNRKREEFNLYTTSHFRDEITAQQQMILKYAHLTPLIARAMVRSSAQRIVQEMEDMIALKAITDHLPPISELKEMPELLEALWEVH